MSQSPDTRAERKAIRFAGRLVYVLSTPDGIRHELLYARHGTLEAIVSYEPVTRTLHRLDPVTGTVQERSR